MSEVTPLNTRIGGITPNTDGFTAHEDGGFTAVGIESTVMYSLIATRSALKLEINTGMKMSRGISVLKILQDRGITQKRTKRGAYADLDAYIVKCGGQPRPLN